MNQVNTSLEFFIQLSKAKTIISRRLDNKLSQRGIGFNEFIILYFVHSEPTGKIRRIDIAEKLGITASGVTRMLLPMEKIGLIKREANEFDARSSYVSLAPGGLRILEESIPDAEEIAEELLPGEHIDKDFISLLVKLGKTTIY